MKLHEAIKYVLEIAGTGLSAKEIAYRVNAQNLYERKDRLDVPSSQIHARVRRYPHMFIKDSFGNISLKNT